MQHVTEYRDQSRVRELAKAIRDRVTRPWSIMEVCGGQTHAIVRFGLDQLLPPEVDLLHGPGCPVCVTPLSSIDRALAIARRPGVIFCTFGDMLRVPGTTGDLFRVKAAGGDVRPVYSPLDAVNLATKYPDREVVFFAIGFETTIPANALAVQQARARGLNNFSLLVSQVRVPPAIEAILQALDCRVQGFLAAGHVCAVMGTREYPPLVDQYQVPIVVTGFEPVDLLRGLWQVVDQLERGAAQLENAYERVVTSEGNLVAQQVIQEVFQIVDWEWRGIGMIPRSGWQLRPEYAAFDAVRRFELRESPSCESPLCRSGDVLRGLIKPPACPAFGRECTPESPLGATMVSAEGACAAYYSQRRDYANIIPDPDKLSPK